ncbi:MAG: glycoside hydrolase family 43 protein, partial [Acidimicrobiales bacterium]|nr:glycoside hydrolase family 43 protein [Acidimicrobiales bacterium]
MTTRTRARRRIVALLTAVAVTVVSFAAPADADTDTSSPVVRPPVVEADVPDPELVRDPESGLWHLFGTNGIDGNVPHRSSPDLATWSTATDALPTVGRWALAGFTWAPGVVRIEADGSWALYYSAHDPELGVQCIGHATASAPEGPYVDESETPLLCQPDLGGSIDASPFVDVDGSLWLHWKSDENSVGQASRLWAQPLSPDGSRLMGRPTAILDVDARWEGPLVEQPELVHHAGRYTLFYSGGHWDRTDYAIGHATCAGPAGPCTKTTADDPWVSSGSTVVGPGALSVVAGPDGQLFGAFHGWRGPVGHGNGGYRGPHLEPLVLRSDGPVLRPDLPRGAPTSTLAPADRTVVGDFDGDGDDDLFAHDPGGRLDTLYLAVGDATFEAQPMTVRGSYSPLAGDFDGDGADDILWYAPGTKPDYLWTANGDTTFQSTRTTINGNYQPITGDFNGDTTHDIVWYAPGTKPDYLWTANGDT